MIRRLNEGDWQAFKSLRLEALEQEPQSFAADVEEYRKQPDEYWESRSRGNPSTFTVGAFINGHLVGMVGLSRHLPTKIRHKAFIWGMYVSSAHRRVHLGSQLLGGVLQEARAMEGLELVTLSVVATNTPAVELYRKYGFKSFGTEPRALKVGSTYVDEEHMTLVL